MNIKNISLLLIINGVFLHSIAQRINLTGLVTDNKGVPVPQASLELRASKDSSSVQQTMTDQKGFFNFTVIFDDTYFISASSSGFLNTRGLNFIITNGNVPFDSLKIILTPSEKILTAVTVTSRKPLIENKPDKTVVNVDAFLNNAGSSLLEVLGNSPNVEVDFNGSINVKGRAGVLVFIDGKQNYLTGAALINFLNGITASQVDQIEIMTQPPARYDASGNSGVINIKLKKNKQTGLTTNLSVSYMQGFYPGTLNSLAINYKRNKWNFFSNVNYDYIKRYTRRNLSRYIYSNADNSNVQYNQDENDISIAPGHSIVAGVDYAPGKNWSLGLALSNKGSGQENDVTDISVFKDLNNDGKAISFLNDHNSINTPWVNTGIGLNLKNTGKNKREWSADLNYEKYNFNSQQQSSNYSYDSSGILIPAPLNPYIQRAILPSFIEIFSAKTDYSYSLKKIVVETGAKVSFIQSSNNSSFYFLHSNTFQQDSNLTNYYDYKENINAAYFNLARQLKRWSWQAGLRLEETNTSGKQNVSGQNFRKSYIQLFPTLFISYDPDENNNFTLSYGRRIDRPNYLDLNPFLYLLDQYTYRKGNPDLKPFFSNAVELGYTCKGNLHADFDYGKTSGVIDNLLSQNDSTRVLLQSPANLNTLTTIALNIGYTLTIKKWSSIVLSYSLYNNHYTGETNGNKIDNNVTTNLINYTQQFRFTKGWSVELNIIYRSNILLNALATRGPRKISGFAIGKDILKSKGNIKLRVTDPLYIQQSYGSTKFGDIHTTTNFREDSRRIGLTFTYRFQKGVKSNPHKIYSPEEKSRINQGQ
jgi:hypothetical protein